MHLSILYWLALLLPGFALLRWTAPRLVEGGLPGTIAVSMLATAALLTPINILGHAIGAPLWVFSAALAALVAASIVFITMRRWWNPLAGVLLAGLCLELFILLVVLVIAARSGSHLLGDAHTHLARIRMLIDDGMINGHPFYGGAYFFPTYHTNIWHALIAAESQLLGMRHHDAWWTTRPIAVLLCFGGVWQLAWAVFQRRWAAWTASLFMLGAFGSIPFLCYPNKLAPLWIMAVIIALAVDAVREPRRWANVVMIGAAAIVLGQVHGLYTIFIAATVAPVLAGVMVVHFIGRQPRAAMLIGACAAACCIGLAFPAYSALRTDVLEQRVSAFADADESDDADEVAAADAERGLTTRFGRGFTGQWWRAPAILVMAIVLLVLGKPQRSAVGLLLAVFLVCGAWLWLPMLYQPLTAALGGDWASARMSILFRISFFVLVAGGVAVLLEIGLQRVPVAAGRWQPWRLASLGLVPLGAWLFAPGRPFDWASLLETSRRPAAERLFVLQTFHTLQDFTDEAVPDDAVVLAPPALGQIFTTVADCAIVYAYSSNLGAEDRPQRDLDRRRMLSNRTPDALRDRLLDEYSVDCVAFVGEPRSWALSRAESRHAVRLDMLGNAVTLIRLKP